MNPHKCVLAAIFSPAIAAFVGARCVLTCEDGSF
jgi:hypothetical protein